MQPEVAVDAPVREAAAMIAGMDPELQETVFHFCTTSDPDIIERVKPLGTFREAEGMSLILPEVEAKKFSLPMDLPMRQITLRVHSALDGVGLTAAVAGALADHDIPCNVVAAFHHDHVFVPADLAEKALTVLRVLAST